MRKIQEKIKRIERILQEDEVDGVEKAPYPFHFKIEWTWYRRLQVRMKKNMSEYKFIVLHCLFHIDTLSCYRNGLI